MTYTLVDNINLYVKDRIARADADRQHRTAEEILRRLCCQPGVVLADEVGMGKTFVALAVAVSVHLTDQRRRPVVVMVPSSLHEKWQSDFELFREKCVQPEVSAKLQYGSADRAEDLLKLLADPLSRRRGVLFVRHGVMSCGLRDPFVKVAIIQQALYRRHNTRRLRTALCRCMGSLVQAEGLNRGDGLLWDSLLSTEPEQWHRILDRRDVAVERTADGDVAEVVPLYALRAIRGMKLDDLYQQLWDEVPRRWSDTYDDRIVAARRSINDSLKTAWRVCLKRMRLQLPLLVLDEAHHLKNARTQLASLFQSPEAQEDANELMRGELAGVFERMLFLTATPFQLGHRELCSVLDRFGGIAWQSARAPDCGRNGFREEMEALRAVLDRAQEASFSLDATWGMLRSDESTPAAIANLANWCLQSNQCESRPDGFNAIVDAFTRAKRRLGDAEDALRPWVIRHLKPRHLPAPAEQLERRRRLCGAAILDDDAEHDDGLEIHGEALLPFLLAARVTACTPNSRPVFAEGLASSYEAFLQTREVNRKRESAVLDNDDAGLCAPALSREAKWYLEQLTSFLPLKHSAENVMHPKIAATVQRVVNAWERGEKVCVFCHYVITGRVLRQRISDCIAERIRSMAAAKMGCRVSEAVQRLERLGLRFSDESPIRRACDTEVEAILAEFSALQDRRTEWLDIARRNLRTAAMLVRYFPLKGRLNAAAMSVALNTHDGSGLTLRELLRGFFEALQKRCGQRERERYLSAMSTIQTGGRTGADGGSIFSDDELQGSRADRLLGNVRLVNGSTQHETRERLMLAFNTPFAPDILVASSVMAEGVDLHLNCRTVIHHDLSWNPSTLEQRTGRLDRIGAKAERCLRPIDVYVPYIGETQDEKMYRVVMDRERWFNVVMGEGYRLDARSTDNLAQRVPLPPELAEELRFRFEVVTREDPGKSSAIVAAPQDNTALGVFGAVRTNCV